MAWNEYPEDGLANLSNQYRVIKSDCEESRRETGLAQPGRPARIPLPHDALVWFLTSFVSPHEQPVLPGSVRHLVFGVPIQSVPQYLVMRASRSHNIRGSESCINVPFADVEYNHMNEWDYPWSLPE